MKTCGIPLRVDTRCVEIDDVCLFCSVEEISPDAQKAAVVSKKALLVFCNLVLSDVVPVVWNVAGVIHCKWVTRHEVRRLPTLCNQTVNNSQSFVR